MAEKYAIIVAGGAGTRMGGVKPKQFLEIGRKPILMHTMELFLESEPSISIVLVLPEAYMASWADLCVLHKFQVPHKTAVGGATRFQSVKNGLQLLPSSGVVAVHDGVRPFVAPAVIQQSFATALKRGSAITSLPLKETIRELTGEFSESRDRAKYRLVQTPQTFQVALLKRAYEQPELPIFTDDASVVEQAGERVSLIEGNEENIKITHKADLIFAEALLKNKKSPKN